MRIKPDWLGRRVLRVGELVEHGGMEGCLHTFRELRGKQSLEVEVRIPLVCFVGGVEYIP